MTKYEIFLKFARFAEVTEDFFSFRICMILLFIRKLKTDFSEFFIFTFKNSTVHGLNKKNCHDYSCIASKPRKCTQNRQKGVFLEQRVHWALAFVRSNNPLSDIFFKNATHLGFSATTGGRYVGFGSSNGVFGFG